MYCSYFRNTTSNLEPIPRTHHLDMIKPGSYLGISNDCMHNHLWFSELPYSVPEHQYSRMSLIIGLENGIKRNNGMKNGMEQWTYTQMPTALSRLNNLVCLLSRCTSFMSKCGIANHFYIQASLSRASHSSHTPEKKYTTGSCDYIQAWYCC